MNNAKCPACQEEIIEGAKICKHCKSQIVQRPHCLENTLGTDPKCVVCGSAIDIVAHANGARDSADSTSEWESTSPNTIFLKEKKSFGMAVFLNLLWAGWGVYYAKATKGRWIAWVNIVAFILSFASAAIPSLILFVWSTIICSKHVEIFNAELSEAIKSGHLDGFKQKYSHGVPDKPTSKQT